jgi:hypothetical protein
MHVKHADAPVTGVCSDRVLEKPNSVAISGPKPGACGT